MKLGNLLKAACTPDKRRPAGGVRRGTWLHVEWAVGSREGLENRRKMDSALGTHLAHCQACAEMSM